jgi:superfamily II DNA/RNA helicase
LSPPLHSPSTRALDLLDLSHVFVMGVPEGGVDSYTHIAGRTGRFGKTGKIATVAEKIEEIDDGKGGRKTGVVKNEERKMRGNPERDENHSEEGWAL